jgi:nucleoside-diphosphate-sugar epimerase
MASLVILGASGFLGKCLIAAGNLPMPIKAISRTTPSDVDIAQEGVTWIAVDILNIRALNEVLDAGDIVINLAFMSGASKFENICLIDNIIVACLNSKVARLVHCSTAVVVGATASSRVIESTTCKPLTPYEQTKWSLEQRVLESLSKGLDVGILRPTAVVGPGGKNLFKLARSLKSGNRVSNYFRASLYGKRHMHLVPVNNVVAALIHLAIFPRDLSGNIYILSSDDDYKNNFQDVEEILLQSLGQKPRYLPLLPLPKCLLSLLLRLLGRSDTNSIRIYDSSKLLSTNFKPIDSVMKAVIDFGDTFNSMRK